MKVDWKKRIHIIIGTDEESDWKCTERYFQTEEMPTLGFAPDAEFPAIHGEKGITTFDLVQNSTSEDQDEPDYELISFESGQRYNMVPDAQARVFVKENMTDVVQHFEHYLDQHKLQGESVVDSGELVLTLEGKAVHGMDPSLGVNAGLYLLDFISTLNLNQTAREFVDFSNRYLHESHFGEKMGMKFHTDVMGDVTTNVGIISYDNKQGGRFGINLRYPQNLSLKKQYNDLQKKLKHMDLTLN